MGVAAYMSSMAKPAQPNLPSVNWWATRSIVGDMVAHQTTEDDERYGNTKGVSYKANRGSSVQACLVSIHRTPAPTG
ncbi:hypothetical protein PTI98_005561 [Pleurotus ostreatus]|nr:hypothetical protein PTI98_005561 [Pleurotus ostreatus]